MMSNRHAGQIIVIAIGQTHLRQLISPLQCGGMAKCVSSKVLLLNFSPIRTL